MKKIFFILLLMLTVGLFSQESRIDLSGKWDLNDANSKTKPSTNQFTKVIELPGSLQEQGFGIPFSTSPNWFTSTVVDDWKSSKAYAPYCIEGNLKFPFWLQPETEFQGYAWYRKRFSLDEISDQQSYILFLERVHWQSKVFVNGVEAGTQDSLCIPHQYEIANLLHAGENEIVIRVNNKYIYNIGKNSHSISDHTQGNWNGIVGEIQIVKSSKQSIRKLDAYYSGDQIRIETTLSNSSVLPSRGAKNLQCQIKSMEGDVLYSDEKANFTKQTTFIFPVNKKLKLWDELSPTRYKVSIQLKNQSGILSQQEMTTGFRTFDINTKDKRFSINGKNCFMRGTVDCAIFPLTGYPPTKVEQWLKIFKLYKDFGLNHVRFHSWCPPEAAFNAADQLGLYLQIEGPSWANQGASLGANRASRFIKREIYSIIDQYGHHPSFVMMAYGNEPSGLAHRSFLKKLVIDLKKFDSRRVYTTAAGWPTIEENQFQNIPAPRIQDWGEGLRSIINAEIPSTSYNFIEEINHFSVPVVSHEIGQWCAYPDFNEIEQYTGHLKAKNFEIFRELLHQNIPGDYEQKFLIASGELQTLCYKADIEAALRTPGFGGFQLLGLQDFPGQGTALVGVINALYQPKPYTDANRFSQFCSPVVPLALFERRSFYSDENFMAEVQIANFSSENVTNGFQWKISNIAGKTLISGKLVENAAQGTVSTIGKIDVDLSTIETSQELFLVIYSDEKEYRNSWPIYCYDRKKITSNTTSPEIRICTDKQELLTAIISKEYKKIVMLADPKNISTSIKSGFSTVFWNTKWTMNQAPHTLGFYLDTTHPIWKNFATDSSQDWRWWQLTKNARPLKITDFPTGLTPIVMPIDTWFTARRLSFLFEAKINGCDLLFSSFNTTQQEEPSVAAFIQAVKSYSMSEDFQPNETLTIKELKSIF